MWLLLMFQKTLISESLGKRKLPRVCVCVCAQLCMCVSTTQVCC